MTKAVFPGSFDPPTNGHLNIIKRASVLFDEVDVVIAVNSDKNYLFSEKERIFMLTEITKKFSNVKVHTCSGLIVDYAKKTGSKVLLRGIRNFNDFSYEFDLSLLNHKLDNQIETLFIPTEQKYLLLKSSSIKELAKYNGDISEMVPEIVEKMLLEKLQNKNII